MIEINNNVDGEMAKSLELFQAAINAKSNLEIIGCEYNDGSGCGSDILIVQNSDIAEDIEGHQVTVEVPEIFARVRTAKRAKAMVDVITNDRKAIVCEGVTRIVGYYSRTQNWNKSKVGELRDRQGKNYALSGQAPVHDKARNKAANALS